MPYHAARADSRSRALSSASKSHRVLPSGHGPSRGATSFAPAWAFLSGSNETEEHHPWARGKPASGWKCWYDVVEQTAGEAGEAIELKREERENVIMKREFGNGRPHLGGEPLELRYLRQDVRGNSRGIRKLNHCSHGFWCSLCSPLKCTSHDIHLSRLWVEWRFRIRLLAYFNGIEPSLSDDTTSNNDSWYNKFSDRAVDNTANNSTVNKFCPCIQCHCAECR